MEVLPGISVIIEGVEADIGSSENIVYKTITEEEPLNANAAYLVNGLSRLNLTLPDAQNGNRVILYSASLAGFRVSANARIQHDQYITSVNGYLDSGAKGTHIVFEKSFVNWIATIYTGYCQLV